ncbi:4-oxalocrotonate tautomerase family protein [Streptomyces sp. NBC_01012]|uniref:tautomerase family protein n=1 Tax=Streptomyces sp. NBC_01012 TaxID=2903717 RepID=UPI003868EB66|nr:tautomerase family protein [Streptomyces sp. NBC_01012]
MPQIAVTIAKGRTPQQIRNMLHEVHAAVLRTVDTRPEHIRVTVHEVPHTHWATGDVTIAETRSLPADGSAAVEPAAAMDPAAPADARQGGTDVGHPAAFTTATDMELT